MSHGHEDPIANFYVKLPKDRQTEGQTDRQTPGMRNLRGGTNASISVAITAVQTDVSRRKITRETISERRLAGILFQSDPAQSRCAERDIYCRQTEDVCPSQAVASLGLVSPGAATDGVAYFFLEKN